MSLLFLLEEKIETGIDGHSIYLYNILKELKKRKISFFVIYNKKNFFYSMLEKENFKIEIIDINSKNIKKILSPIHIFKIRKKIKKFIISNSIKHIHASSSNNLIFLSNKWGITISCNQHGAFEKKNFKFYLNFLQKHSCRNIIKSIISNFLLFNFNKASLIICSGKDAENTCRESYKVPKKKIITLFNVANLDLTNLINIKKDLKIENIKKIIIGIGRIQKDKGVEDFCKIAEMFSNNKNLKFVYVGPKISGEYSNKIIKKYRHIVDFIGIRNDINNLLYSSEILLHLSHRESFPQIILESMSIPTIPITWKTIGCNEVIIDNYNGISCKFGNYEMVFNAINNVLEDKILNNKLKRNSKDFVKKYTISNLVDAYILNVFKHTL